MTRKIRIFRYKLALKLINRANDLLDKGGIKNLRKSLKYWRWSIAIVPPSEELVKYKEEFIKYIEKHQKELESL